MSEHRLSVSVWMCALNSMARKRLPPIVSKTPLITPSSRTLRLSFSNTANFSCLRVPCVFLCGIFYSPSRTDAVRLSATTAEVELTKFDALPGHTLASIRLSESLDALEFSHETPHWGRVDIVAETSDLGLYCLNIAPGQTLPLHQHKVMSESEYIMDDGLTLITLNDEPKTLTVGETFTWPHGFVHGYPKYV